MSRKPRIPGMAGGCVYRLDVATGGRPTEAMIQAAASAIPYRPGEVCLLDVCHDAGCPATPRGPMDVCTCEIVGLRARRAA